MNAAHGGDSAPAARGLGGPVPAAPDARARPGLTAGDETDRGLLPAMAAQRMTTPEDEFRDLLSIAFECFPIGALIFGLDGTFLHVNPAICRLLGRSVEELKRHKISDFVGPDQRTTMAAVTASILDGSVENYRQDIVFVRPDGGRMRLDMTGAVLRSASGRPRAILAIAREISEPAPASADSLRSAQREPLPADDAGVDETLLRDEFESFCRTVSQEFRIPLRIIEGYSSIVVEDCGERLDAAALRHISTVRDQSRRLSAMIDNTLTLARIASRPLKRERVDLSALALDAAAVVRAESHAHDVAVEIEPHLVADVDSSLAARLLRHLFENAFRFSRSSATPRIEFGRTDASGQPAFFMRDNGSGFDMAFSYKLFQPFETLHEGSEAAGTGVGLAEVRRIVARHGGRVWAAGVPGRGATFYFTLPPVEGPESSPSKL